MQYHVPQYTRTSTWTHQSLVASVPRKPRSIHSFDMDRHVWTTLDAHLPKSLVNSCHATTNDGRYIILLTHDRTTEPRRDYFTKPKRFGTHKTKDSGAAIIVFDMLKMSARECSLRYPGGAH